MGLSAISFSIRSERDRNGPGRSARRTVRLRMVATSSRTLSRSLDPALLTTGGSNQVVPEVGNPLRGIRLRNTETSKFRRLPESKWSAGANTYEYTKEGADMCGANATAEGDRLSKNGH